MAESFLQKARARAGAAARIARPQSSIDLEALQTEGESFIEGRDNHDADDFNRALLLGPQTSLCREHL